MTFEEIPITRRERIARRRWRSDTRRTTSRRVDQAREWLGRFTPSRTERETSETRRT